MLILQSIALKLLDVLAESGPYILLGFAIAGVLHVLLPESVFSRVFGREGIKPLLRAIGLGSLIPICSCGVVPIGIGAYRGGAATGTVLAFMTAAPTLSPASVLLSLKLLGVSLTVWQVIMVAVGAFALGLLGNRLFVGLVKPKTETAPASKLPESELVTLEPMSCCAHHEPEPVSLEPVSRKTEQPLDSCCESDSGGGAPAQKSSNKIYEMFRWTFADFGPSVSLDMLVGLIFAATVLTLVPSETIVLLTGSKTIWSLLLVVVVALPVYTCSMAALPVVFSFLAAGMSPGAAIAFIIAGPATNFGEMNAIRAQIGWRQSLYYFVSLVTVAVASGFLLDNVIQPPLPATVENAPHMHDHEGAYTLLQWFSIVVMAGMMLLEISRRIARFLPTSGPAAPKDCCNSKETSAPRETVMLEK